MAVWKKNSREGKKKKSVRGWEEKIKKVKRMGVKKKKIEWSRAWF